MESQSSEISPPIRPLVRSKHGDSPMLAPRGDLCIAFDDLVTPYVEREDIRSSAARVLPGWENAEFDGEFDIEARSRMIKGGRLLLPMLANHIHGGKVLEMGPFLNPLVTPYRFKGSKINYFDNDKGALQFLRDTYGDDVNLLEGDLRRLADSDQARQVQPDYMVASQVINYLNYREFLSTVRDLLRADGLLFLNNVPNYGIPEFFSSEGARPTNNREIMEIIQQLGFEIVEHVLIPPTDPTSCRIFPEQRHARLLLVAKKVETDEQGLDTSKSE